MALYQAKVMVIKYPVQLRIHHRNLHITSAHMFIHLMESISDSPPVQESALLSRQME